MKVKSRIISLLIIICYRGIIVPNDSISNKRYFKHIYTPTHKH